MCERKGKVQSSAALSSAVRAAGGGPAEPKGRARPREIRRASGPPGSGAGTAQARQSEVGSRVRRCVAVAVRSGRCKCNGGAAGLGLGTVVAACVSLQYND